MSGAGHNGGRAVAAHASVAFCLASRSPRPERPLMADSGSQSSGPIRLLSGTKRTSTFAELMSATDPKRTFAWPRRLKLFIRSFFQL
jgi:hypothetical protein